MIQRVLITTPPRFTPRGEPVRAWEGRGDWPARWIAPAEPLPEAFVFAARLRLRLDRPLATRLHVSADERYELFVDGEPAGRGPEVGERTRWFYDSYDLQLAPHEHVIVARVWGMGPKLARWAMGSVRPGFLLCPEDDAAVDGLATGVAAWETRLLDGYRFLSASQMLGSHVGGGAGMELDGRLIDWQHPAGLGDGWSPAKAMHEGNSGPFLYVHKPVHWLYPAMLPPQMERPFDADLGTVPRDVSAGTRVRVVCELDDYCCFYPQLTVSGGRDAQVELRFAETLFHERGKQARNVDPAAARFIGFGDSFLLDGLARTYQPLWWRCGRFVEVTIQTAAEPITDLRLQLMETRYPFEPAGRFESSDPSLQPILAACRRTLQMCMHETFMDCPYYEQLMYAGDTRLQMLIHYAHSPDDRLARKALVMFDVSRANATGLTTSNTPAPAGQMIPPFALWWVCTIHDFATWRGDLPFIATLLPGARAVVDQFLARIDRETGLFRSLPGWNYVDTAWPQGVPSDGREGFSGPINLQLVLALRALAELEKACGEPELRARYTRRASELSDTIVRRFWDDDRGVLWDDLGRTTASQHAQCLAILADVLPPPLSARAAAAMETDPTLLQARPYFLHYLFEAYARLGRIDRFFAGLQPWRRFLELGLKTTPEHFEDGRSDCHAWSAHPAFHVLASVLGIRPAGVGFTRVTIRPQLGELTEASGEMPHPRGLIRVSLRRDGETLQGEIELPEGLFGSFEHAGQLRALKPGRQSV
jgi:alpha-L-rhamnosidase